MNFGTQNIQDIIYQQVKKAGYKGGIAHGKFAKDTAKLIYELLEGEDSMNRQWNMAHDFPQHLEKIVRRLEKGLNLGMLKRTPEAQKAYEFIEEQIKEGKELDKFIAWANSPERKQYIPKYFSKPEYLIVDYPQAFIQTETKITRNEDGSINV